MKPWIILAASLAGLTLSASSHAQNADLRAIFSAPIGIERADESTSIPIGIRMDKLFIDASINGETREFIFDTGSPTLITREFADALGLVTLAQNTGTDAHGARVTMDVAVAETLTLGGVTFTDVPVLIFDPSTLELGPCVFDGGVIGSEIFPGNAWRIDTETRTLTIAATPAADDRPAVRAALSDFGYPHAPIIDYRIGDLSDRALFDTGSSEAVTLFAQVADARPVRQRIDADSLREGRGIEGISAGGASEVGDLRRFTLEEFELGGVNIGPLDGTVRRVPPTLVGAGLLSRFVVTLDYVNGELRLSDRTQPEPRAPHAGYAIGYENGEARVAQLFEGSPAAEAGLELGDHVVVIDGRSTRIGEGNPLCSAALWLADGVDLAAARTLEVERGGATLRIELP
ncbi:aspartyl protease family protein [Hyphobacterium sp. SN044]|uniref:aspartyl protease family protein n=1 Tax=Hyphobacterium sp. SN044 TaxID=2912575 RepID=UPI001F240BEE|nr:aspartyl protease family protein [Hyphobacterium sp. SN044]MCF8878216.1 aspartyl protease family protein [Hyphobacterium sp. SN044]